MIKKIFHVADLHQQLYKKHDVSLFAYKRFIESVKEQDVKHNLTYNEGVIVIAGDLFHQFSNVSNESNLHIINLLQSLLKLHRVVMIAGNHDWNENNQSRLDSITPIYRAINNSNLSYFNASQCYEIDNLLFCNYSVFEDLARPNLPQTQLTKVGLYHAPLASSRTIFGEVKGAKITTDIFDGCDFVICGDIHQYQVLKYNNIDVVYSGSLFQQNMGESVNGHGYVLWDVETKTHDFIEIQPKHNYYAVEVNSPESIDNNEERFTNLHFTDKSNKTNKLNTDCEIKVKFECYKSEEASFKKDVKEKLIQKYGLNKKTEFKWDRTFKKQLVSETNLNLNDVSNGHTLIPKIDTWVARSTNDANIQQRFSELLKEKIQTLTERGEWNLPTESKFTVLSFGAKNLLSFKEIELNLNDYKGITVVYADNGVGKTHINRLITYLLFGEFYKKDERQTHKDAFNWYVNIGDAYGWIKIELDGKLYLIEHDLTKNKKGDVSHTLRINQINEKGESLLDLTPKKVEKDKLNKSNLDEFKDKLGTVKDFLFTSFFDSFNLEKWVDDGQAAVNERIFRYQGLESLVKIQKLAKEDYKTFLNASPYLKISKDAVNTEITEIERVLIENSVNIGINKQSITDLEIEVTDLDNQILLNHKKIKAVGEGLANYDLYKNEQNLNVFNKQLTDLRLKYVELIEKQKTFDVNVDFTEIENKRNSFSNSLKNIEVNTQLLQKIENLDYMKNSYKPNEEMGKRYDTLVLERTELLTQYRTFDGLVKSVEQKLKELPDKFECGRCGQVFAENDYLKTQLLTEKDGYYASLLIVKNKGIDIKKEIEILENLISLEKTIFIVEIDNKIKGVKREIDEDRKTMIDVINVEIDIWNKKYQMLNQKNMVDDELKRNSLQSTELERKINVIKEEIGLYMNSVTIIEFNQQIEVELQNLRVSQKSKQNFGVELSLRNNDLVTQNVYKSKLLIEKGEVLENIIRDDFTSQVYKFFIDAFGRGGFPKHIIQTLLPNIEKDVQEILGEVGFDFNFSIESDDETVKFYLERDGIKNEVKKYSGFEKWLPCLALHKAIMPSCLVPYSNIITFDEIFSAPSEKNLPSCYKMMEKMNEVYENVMIISHNSDIRSFADNVINLIKIDNITEIVN